MKRTALVVALFLCLFGTLSLGQVRRVDPSQMYERILCIVPIVGKGTSEDPRRPKFVPTAEEKAATRSAVKEGEEQLPDMGIIAFGFQESDDGKYAIVEFVARSRAAFKEIVESRDPDIKVFRKDRMAKAELSNELKKVKKDFDIEKFAVEVQ